MLDYFKVLEFIAFMIGLMVYNAIKPIYLKLILIILFITLINEVVVVPYLKVVHVNRNTAYNIFSVIDIIVWLVIFMKIHSKEPRYKWLIVLSGLCLAICLFELVFVNGWGVFHTTSHRLYDILIVCYTALYFYRLLQKPYFVLYTDSVFWVCLACFMYHALLFLNFTLLSDYYYLEFKNSREIYRTLQFLYNSFYYPLLTIAFVVCHFNYKYKMMS